MLAPAEMDKEPLEPFKLVTTVGKDGVEAEIVNEPFPAPIDTIPAPEMARTLFAVPEELDVVFPDADSDIVLKLVTDGVVALIVTVLPFIPTETMPAPEKFSALETAKLVEAMPRVLPKAVAESDEV